MDVSGLLLLVLLTGAIALKVRTERRLRSSIGHQRRRIIAMAASGAFLLVAGLAGRDVRFSRAWPRGMPQDESLVWWEVALGAALIAIAIAWARRLPNRPAPQSTEFR